MKKEILNGKYTIDTDGNIYVKNGLVKQVILRGYYIISIKNPNIDERKSKRKKTYSVHRLVAEAFIPNPNNKPHVNHIDGNKLNNRVENLEWVTQSENMRHAVETGLLYHIFNPEKTGTQKLNWDKVRDIRRLSGEENYSANNLSEIYGISRVQVRNIIRNICWTE